MIFILSDFFRLLNLQSPASCSYVCGLEMNFPIQSHVVSLCMAHTFQRQLFEMGRKLLRVNVHTTWINK